VEWNTCTNWGEEARVIPCWLSKQAAQTNASCSLTPHPSRLCVMWRQPSVKPMEMPGSTPIARHKSTFCGAMQKSGAGGFPAPATNSGDPNFRCSSFVLGITRLLGNRSADRTIPLSDISRCRMLCLAHDLGRMAVNEAAYEPKDAIVGAQPPGALLHESRRLEYGSRTIPFRPPTNREEYPNV
jgi:hypothetical protein